MKKFKDFLNEIKQATGIKEWELNLLLYIGKWWLFCLIQFKPSKFNCLLIYSRTNVRKRKLAENKLSELMLNFETEN